MILHFNTLASPQYPGRLHCVFPGCLPPDVPGDGLPGSQVPETTGHSEDGGDSLHQPGAVNLYPAINLVKRKFQLFDFDRIELCGTVSSVLKPVKLAQFFLFFPIINNK